MIANLGQTLNKDREFIVTYANIKWVVPAVSTSGSSTSQLRTGEEDGYLEEVLSSPES